VAALCIAFGCGVVVSAGRVVAESSSSTHYQMVETEFGAGSTLESCSTTYCATSSMGDIGGASSATSPGLGGAQYTEPTLEMTIVSGPSDLGVLTTEHTATKTTTIKVRNYLSGGYSLQLIGDAPKFEGHSLTALARPTASTRGKEQFGINVVANTTPSTGKDPTQVPSEEGLFGEAAEGYATANMFKYVSGDVIAHSTQTTGGTDYTITMIINISSDTPSGLYSGDFSAVLIPAY